MSKDESIFEILYNEFGEDLTIEDLDKIFNFISGVNTNIFFARFGFLIPFAVLTYQVLQFFEKLSQLHYFIGTIVLIVIWIYIWIDTSLYVKKFYEMQFFKDYFKIRKMMKMNNVPNGNP